MKKTQIKKYLPLLKLLKKLKADDKKTLLHFLDENGSDIICECIYNSIRNTTIPHLHRKELKKTLADSKRPLRYLSKLNNNPEKRRKLLPQLGAGTLDTILSVVIPVLTALL